MIDFCLLTNDTGFDKFSDILSHLRPVKLCSNSCTGSGGTRMSTHLGGMEFCQDHIDEGLIIRHQNFTIPDDYLVVQCVIFIVPNIVHAILMEW